MTTPVYKIASTSTGGGRDGHVKSADGHIDMDVRPPKELGGSGEGTNPEELFASGYAACFNGALQQVLRMNGVKVEKQPEVTVETTLNKVDDGFIISVNIDATLYGLDEPLAQEYVDRAHAFCPYSRATAGNIEHTVTAHAAAA